MKKIIVLLFVFAFVFFEAFPVYAEGSREDISQSEEYQEIVEDLTQGLENAAGDDVNEILEEQEISLKNPESISEISIGSVIKSVVSSFTDVIKRPAIMLGKIIAITLLCVTAKSMAPEGSSVTKAFNIIGILSTITVMYETVYSSIEIIRVYDSLYSHFLKRSSSRRKCYCLRKLLCGNLDTL